MHFSFLGTSQVPMNWSASWCLPLQVLLSKWHCLSRGWLIWSRAKSHLSSSDSTLGWTPLAGNLGFCTRPSLKRKQRRSSPLSPLALRKCEDVKDEGTTLNIEHHFTYCTFGPFWPQWESRGASQTWVPLWALAYEHTFGQSQAL